MKKNLLLMLAMLGLAIPAIADPTTNAPSVLLGWDQVADSSVTGYRVYYGTASRTYTNHVSVQGIANTTCWVTNLVRGVTYHFAATSVAANGLESDYSAEVTYATIPLPPEPANLTIKEVKQ